VHHLIPRNKSAEGARMLFVGSVGQARSVKSGATVIAAGDYEAADESKDPGLARGGDWILIRLDQCLGAELGYATLIAGEPEGPVESAGFPIDRPWKRGPTIDPHCAITSARPLVFLDDCATLQGDSGGPIFKIAPATADHPERLEVFAIQSAGMTTRRPIAYHPGWDNLATPSWEILGHITRLIVADERAAAADRNAPRDMARETGFRAQ
jgi:hypothetical protein